MLAVTGLDLLTGEVSFEVTDHQYLDDGLAPGNGTSADSSTVTVTITDSGGLQSAPLLQEFIVNGDFETGDFYGLERQWNRQCQLAHQRRYARSCRTWNSAGSDRRKFRCGFSPKRSGPGHADRTDRRSGQRILGRVELVGPHSQSAATYSATPARSGESWFWTAAGA